ncbi:MAG: hypothetical protein VYE73_06745 [Acidobacteriota bacterium]|nr:hypothetical protein [Acidobacteriota bacterium]
MSANRHIGLVSPLPPEATGIADYSASLLPALAQRWPTRAFTRQPNAPQRQLESAVEVLGYGELPPARGSELLIYQLGNHHGFHGDIYRHALATPGIVVLHELALADLVRDSAHHDGGHKAFAEELRYALGATGNALARRIDIDGEGLSAHTWPLFERVVDRSFCTIVHGETAQDRGLASRPTAQVIVAPHHTVEEVADVEAAGGKFRRRHGLGAETLIVAAFGVVAPTKSIGLCLDAFEALTDDRDALFLLVGEGSDAWLGANRPAGSGPTSHRALGRVDASTLVGAMAATDIAFNLRQPTGGETSGACLRLLRLGKPVIVNDHGWFSEIPNDCCVKVGVDLHQRAELQALLAHLASDAVLRRTIGGNAARWAATRHSLGATIDAYAQAIEIAAQVPSPTSPAAPLGRFSRDDVVSELVQELTAAAGDVGITEQDPSALAELAQTIVGLDLHASRRPRHTD